MRSARIALGILALVLGAQALNAQQPAPRPAQPPDSMMGMMQRHLQVMDSLSARLDTLVSRMNRSSGNQKVAAMADVINELVAQRRAMQARMREMMQRSGGMGMPMMERRAPTGAPPTAPDTDSTAHQQHHRSD